MELSNYRAKPDKTIREHTDDLQKNLKYLNELGYITNERILGLTKVACEYHDYGKANREFQYRIVNQTKFDTKKEIPHNVLSIYFIDQNKFKNSNIYEEKDYYRICFAVLYHHYYCDCIEVLEGKETKFLIKELLSDFEDDVQRVRRATIREINNIKSDKEAIIIKGLVNKCDFSASGETVIEYKADFLEQDLEKMLISWKEKNLNAKWNDLQLFCKENTKENIIVVAQTGMGKTEAGLHWIGNNKGFFILPLKTAINAIYARVANGIVQSEVEHKVALIHSDTLSYYNSHNTSEIDILTYQREGKQLSIPLNIATLDQIFDFVLQCKGYEMKLATLSYSKLVIDEIQMYSADLLAYLVYGIKTIIKFGGNVAILTATLAPFIKDLLIGDTNDFNFKEATFINELERHNLKVYNEKISYQTILEKYFENEKLGVSNKILVVCNTVKKAQEIYLDLKDKVQNINIFHSKFTKNDRTKKEDMILNFGRTENVDTGIWIATQIVEASLDIDFDYLFTELSDINGFFQRLGRCNRKGVKSVDNYNCYIFLEVDENILTKDNKGFIDRQIYNLSKNALSSIDGILSEQKKVDIIESTLTTENLKGSKYLEEYTNFIKWIEEVEPYEIDKKDIKLRNIVSFDIIPEIVYLENEDRIDEILAIINNDNSEQNKLNRLKLIDEIKGYTVAVGQHDIETLTKSALISELKLTKFITIPIIRCNYDEIGFSRKRKVDENIDDFMI